MPKKVNPVASKKLKVVIIGGGITGLTSAYYLQERIKKDNLPVEYQLIEASRRLGGKIQTIHKDGFTIEKGPQSFLDRKNSVTRLAEKVGLKDELIGNKHGHSYVLSNDKLYLIPEGAVIGVPTQLKPFILSGLFSFSGKIRAAADLIIPRSKDKDDRSLGGFFRRRFGDEVVENLIEPLLSGIYAGDIDQLSLMATFPQFYEAEEKYRSLIIGARNNLFSHNDSNKDQLLTFRNGLESLVEAIESKLKESSVLKGIRAEKIEKQSIDSGYEIFLNNGERLQADSVIFALPHFHLPQIFSGYNFFEPFRHIPATSVATVAMAFPEEVVENYVDCTNFVVSRNSDYTINACTWAHKMWPQSTPKGKVLLRSYIGRAGDETVVDLSDSEIEQVVLDDLYKLFEISRKPDFTIVSRWKNALPQYTVGHNDRVKKLKENLQINLPGVFVTGSSFEGIGLPDCITQGESAVDDVLQYLKI